MSSVENAKLWKFRKISRDLDTAYLSWSAAQTEENWSRLGHSIFFAAQDYTRIVDLPPEESENLVSTVCEKLLSAVKKTWLSKFGHYALRAFKTTRVDIYRSRQRSKIGPAWPSRRRPEEHYDIAPMSEIAAVLDDLGLLDLSRMGL